MFALIRRAAIAVSSEEATLGHLIASLRLETADPMADAAVWLGPADEPSAI
jgi:hypothetical protein